MLGVNAVNGIEIKADPLLVALIVLADAVELVLITRPDVESPVCTVGIRAYYFVIGSTGVAVTGGLRTNGTALEFYNGSSWVNSSVTAGTNMAFTGTSLGLIASPAVTDITCSGTSMNAVAASVATYLNQAVKTTSSPTFVTTHCQSVTSDTTDLFLNAAPGHTISIATNGGARITARDTYVDHWANAVFWSGINTDSVSPRSTSWAANNMILGSGVPVIGNLKMTGSALQYHNGSGYQTVQSTANTYATYGFKLEVRNVSGTLQANIFAGLGSLSYMVNLAGGNVSADVTMPGTIATDIFATLSISKSYCTVPTGIRTAFSAPSAIRIFPSYNTSGDVPWSTILPNSGDFLEIDVLVQGW